MARGPKGEQLKGGKESMIMIDNDVKPTDAKPCPFCGEIPAVVRETELNWVGGKHDTFFIRCKRIKCPVKPTVSKRTLREVMEAWNTRNP